MKNKHLLFLLGLLLLVPLSLRAYDFKSGDLYYNITSSTEPYTVEVTYEVYLSSDNYSGLTMAVIPETVIHNDTTYVVTSIGGWAFSDCIGLTSVTIPESVTSMGYNVFDRCSHLTLVIWNAKKCDDLPVVPDVNPMLNSPFDDICSQITSFLFGDAVEHIPAHLCYGMNALPFVMLPNSVKSIGTGSFFGCSALTSITIPENVTSIGAEAFGACNALRAVVIPDKVTSIGSGAFAECYNLTTVSIGNRVQSIGRGAFANCPSLTAIIIPNSVQSIGDWAFVNCPSLTAIIIPNSVTEIGWHAFENCSSLTAVTLGNGVQSIGDGAFGGCSGLTAITIPNSVTEIGKGAFNSCSGLTAVIIGNSVRTIGDGAFYGCSGLTAITIPNSVTDIGAEAFKECLGLTSITLSNKLTAIGEGTFDNCKSLDSISVPHSVTSIGNWAFRECSNLHSVTIGSGVLDIGSWIFYGCRQLQTVYCYPMLPPSVPSFILSDYGIANLYVPCEALDVYQKNALWSTTFSSIQCIGSEETTLPGNDVEVEPSTDNAVFAWPSVSAASAYTLVISQEGNEFCTLVFNADGQLNSQTFKSPRRTAESCRATSATAELNGWSFTVTGLSEGTAYTYSLTVTDSMDKVLKTYTGTFKTQGTASTAIEHVSGDTPSGTKILRTGRCSFSARARRTTCWDRK